MRPALLSLTILTLTCCNSAAVAQDDSSRLDNGYMSLKKEFTQTISIEGSDLEKMPFANLSDAIAAWLYGAYTQPAALLYIVDGSPVADVNAYSVYDIDEVILVENAAAMVFTGGGQQEVVLIRTRRGKTKRGMTGAVQTGLVNGGIKGMPTDTRWYHQYYLGANINPGSWRIGASASWLRDVQPISGSYQIVTPDNLQRWRLHAYAEWRPDGHEQLGLTVGYTPEKFRLGTDSTEQQYYSYNVRNSASQRFFLPELRWRGQWLGGLTNELQASYIQSVYRGDELKNSITDTSSDNYYTDSIGGDRSSYHVYVRDRLAYRLASGGWRIEPAMNVSYEHVNERLFFAQSSYGDNGQGYPTYYSTAGGYEYARYHMFFYTPQLDIRYKKGFDFQAGEMVQAGLKEPPGTHKAFFFVSTAFDVLHLANERSGSGLTFFGSYSQGTQPPFPGYQLADLTYGYTNGSLFGNSGNNFAVAGNQSIIYEAAAPSMRFWVWEAGVRYTGWKDRLQIQGNIERRNYALLLFAYGQSFLGQGGIYVSSQVASDMLLHFDARVTILQGGEADWQSGINATILHSKVNGVTTVTADAGLVGYTGDVYPNPYSVTGGWVNRIRVRHFIGGIDLLYHFGETSFLTAPGGFPVVTRKGNPVAIPNIYAGYRFRPAQHGAEVFVESRGLFRNNPSDLAQSRRYFTIGGKLEL
jgi:hypothetical protein